MTIIEMVAAGSLSQTEGSYAGITSHLRKANRLCVGVTRGKFGTVIICNGRTMASGTKDNANVALTAMMTDALERKLISVDGTTPDEHPESLEEAARLSEAQGKHKAEQLELESHAWVDRLN